MIDLEKAKANPGAHFKSPEEVISHLEIATQDKIDILESWRQELLLLTVADEENMAQEEPNESNEELLSEITQILTSIKEDN